MTRDVRPIVHVDALDDPRVAEYRSLRDRELRTLADARARGLFIAEGKLVVERLLSSAYRVRSLFLQEDRLADFAPILDRLPRNVPVFTASRELHAAISGVRFHQGALALGESGEPRTLDSILERATRVVVLERVVNHDNLGGVCRNLAALAGAGGALLLDRRCADPLYRRAIRTSMGWALHVPFARIEPWPGALVELERRGFVVVALTPSPDAVDIARASERPIEKLALLLGAEEPGLSDAALASAHVRARIPMDEGVDSLNLATAAAIALHRFRAG